MKNSFRTIRLLVIPSIFLCLLGLVLYGVTVRGIYGKPEISQVKDNLDQPTMPLELSPERGRYAVVVSLVEDKSFALRRELGLMVYPDVGYYKGKFYSYFAPGISILALPFYQIGLKFNIPQVATYFVISIYAAINLALLYLIAKQILKLPMWASIFSALVFGFASTGWSYAITLYQHQVTTFFILSSLYAAWKIHTKSRFSFVWATLVWFNFGYAVLIDYPNVLLMAPVMIYFAFSSFSYQFNDAEKKFKLQIHLPVVLTSIVLIALVIAHGYYNYVNFGSWKRVSGSLTSYRSIVENNLENQQNAEKIVESKKGIKDPIKFFSEDKTPFGFYTLLFSSDRGLFFYSPIFILSLLGIYLIGIKGNKEGATIIATIAINLFLYSSWGDPWGGWAFGPRYLIPSMAMLSLVLSYWLAKGTHLFLFRSVAFVLFAYSSAISVLGALTTNAVPPKIEADYLGMHYNFLRNLEIYSSGKSGSFVYNHILSHFLSLTTFSVIIWALLLILAFSVLFIFPLFIKNHEH